MNNIIDITTLMKVVGTLLVSGILLYMMNSQGMQQIKKGQPYRNFFKTIFATYKVSLFAINEKWIAIAFLNLLLFLTYLFAIIGGISIMSAVLTTNIVWLPIALFVIGVSLLLHVYVKWFNGYVFNPDNKMNRNQKRPI